MKQSKRIFSNSKLHFWLACLGLVLVQEIGAQGQGYQLGLTLSPNAGFSIPRDFSHESGNSQLHFGYGFIFDAMFTETYAIGTGVNVFYTGGDLTFFESKDIDHVQRVEMTQRLQYVEIPLTFKMRTKEIGYTTYYGQFGVGLGLNVRAEATALEQVVAMRDTTDGWFEVADEKIERNRSLSSQTRFFRPALIVGLGMERRFTGTTALAIGIRYNMGIMSQYQDFEVIQSNGDGGVLYEVDQDPHILDMAGKSGQIEFSIGVMF